MSQVADMKSVADGFDLEAFLPYRRSVLATRTRRAFAALYADFGAGPDRLAQDGA